jgi:glycosyltransferase involved in cell wall biosynthesis/CelD/BcsL family acetyltransferase involved in cellulose biosynthesis
VSEAGRGSICYVGQHFPDVTTTFVEQEVRGLRAQGIDVILCSNRRPDPDHLPAASQSLLDETVSVFPIRWSRVVVAHGTMLVSHPRRYTRALSQLVCARNQRAADRLRSIMHFGGATVLAYAVRDRGVVHVHAHFLSNAATFAVVMAELLAVPYSITVHAVPRDDPPLLREKLRGARFVVAICHDTRRQLLQRSPGAGLADRIRVVRCGVDEEAFAPPRARTPTTSPPLVLAVGQLVAKKGHDVLVAACRRLHDRGVVFRAQIVGAGPEHARLDQLIRAAGLTGTVELVGAVGHDAMPARLQEAAVVALASRIAADGSVDGVPVALMEGMACARAVVSTRIGGIPELIDSGTNGLLVEAGDADALADAIETLLHDAERRAALGAAARRTVLDGWTARRQVDCVADLLRDSVRVRLVEPTGVEVLDQIDAASWDAFLTSATNVSPFHRRAVIDVQRKARGQRVDLLVARDSRGIAAMMPTIVIAVGGRPGSWLTNRRVVHGIAHRPGAANAVRALIDELERRSSGVVLTEIRHHDAIDPVVTHALASAGYERNPHLEIEVVLDGDPEAVLSRIGRSTRHRIRRGVRQGWASVEPVTDESAFAEWFELLRRTYRRIRLPLADRTLFEAAFDAGWDAGFWLVLARVDGVPAASSLELAHGDTVYGWYNGVDRRFSSRVPNELLTWYVIQNACESGFRRYAFGGAGVPGQPYGVRDFKSKFGGESRDLGRHTHVHAPLRSRLMHGAATLAGATRR